MQAKYINPFLSSSIHVLETMLQIRPTIGALEIKNINMHDDHIWLKIGIVGQLTGDILFGFPVQVALKIVSGMMGGYVVTEFDEMSQSAIGELGNMISGNASTMLFNEGIVVDITPPNIVQKDMVVSEGQSRKAFSIPLKLESVGQFDIYVVA